MKNALKNFNAPSSTAHVVDGKLILSLPNALTPVVWQMDMTQAKASALEVRENKEKNHFMLLLKTPRGEDTDIAPFETRAQAVEALMAVSRAFEKAQGNIRPFVQGTEAGTIHHVNQSKKGNAGKWIAGILGVLLLLILFNMWGSMLPRVQNGQSIEPVNLDQVQQSVPDSGVPVSADDFLKTQ